MQIPPVTRPVSPAPPPAPADPHTSFKEVLHAQGRTPMSGEEAERSIRSAWKEVTGAEPSRETVAVLWAQWAHETARGTRMFGFNFAGLKGTGPTGMSLRLRTVEGHDETARAVREVFRAYPDAAQGARDWLELLNHRYPDAVKAAERGDAAGFVRGLRARNYFTGSEQVYRRAIEGLAREAIEGPHLRTHAAPVHLGMWEQGVVDAFRRACSRSGGDEGE